MSGKLEWRSTNFANLEKSFSTPGQKETWENQNLFAKCDLALRVNPQVWVITRTYYTTGKLYVGKTRESYYVQFTCW